MAQLSHNDLATAFVENDEIIKDLVFHEGYQTFFIYEAGRYKKLSAKQFERKIYNFVRAKYTTQKITKQLIKDLIYQVEMQCYRPEPKELDNYISFEDALYNLDTFTTQKKDKSIFTIFHLPYRIEQLQIPIPNFERFLASSIVTEAGDTDYELIKLVQEMFGYLLLGGLKGYRAWFLIGDGANGKGVMSRVLENVFDSEYLQSMTIEDITGSKYNAAELIGKKLNISNEDESKYIGSAKFKALVSGDAIHTEVKFGDGFRFYPKTKYVFCSNRKPVFQDVDYGIKRRLMFIPFNRRFKDGDIDKDLDIDFKLELETPGIIRWALQGAKRLVENNYVYSSSKQSQAMMVQFEEDILTGVMFIREKYVLDDRGKAEKKALYIEYTEYCLSIGKRPLSFPNFKTQLKANIDGLIERRTTLDGSNIRIYNLMPKYEHDREQADVQQSFADYERNEQNIRKGLPEEDVQDKDSGKQQQAISTDGKS